MLTSRFTIVLPRMLGVLRHGDVIRLAAWCTSQDVMSAVIRCHGNDRRKDMRLDMATRRGGVHSCCAMPKGAEEVTMPDDDLMSEPTRQPPADDQEVMHR